MFPSISANLPFRRGTTFLDTVDTTSGEQMLGTMFSCRDVDYSGTGTVLAPRTNLPIIVMPVRNTSGIALLPRRSVVWKASKYGLEVDGYGSTTSQDFAGIVDEYLPTSGAPANSIFFIVIHGPTTILTDLAAASTNSYAQYARLHQLTAATSQATTAGRFQVVDFTTAATGATLGNMVVNSRVRAMSANTTNQTNRNLLAYVTYF